MAVILIPLASAAANGATPIPHDIAGQEKCLTCHSPQGPLTIPENHSAFPEPSCITCHSVETGTPAPAPSPAGSCMQCHSQPGLSMTLGDGTSLTVSIDPGVYQASTHGDKLLCTDCHTDITGYPHPEREIATRRDYNIAQYEVCKRCHFDNYTKTLDSIHYQMFSAGDLRAPVCTDCHGAHDVTPPSEPRAKISQTCSQCHESISQDYIDSVHGRALIEEDNYDVPICTDCHQSHTIEDPRTASFRLESIQLCGGCHSNAELMAKYGISPNVVKTYLQDFHGRTVALVGKETRDIWVEEAVCTDCHGIHDIQPVDSPNSPVIKENIVATCSQCHPDISSNFPGAWLSHYEPSINRAPLIFFVRWFYRILIPFILVGLSVHVLLDLWRRITNR